MASFFDEINRNKVKSMLLMAAFFVLFMVIIWLLVLALGGGLIALAIGALVIVAYAAFSYFLGSKVVLKVSGAQPADPKQYRYLYDTVEGLASAGQIKMPAIYVINDPSPNAFATGRDKNHASVAVTSGLLAMMNKEELEGVIAHEISHIYNNDILFMMIAVVFAGSIGLIGAVVRNLALFGGFSGRGRNGEGLLVIALVIGILGPIFAILLKLAISRRREYMADANGARMIRDPGALASALKKIQAYSLSPKVQQPQVRKANDITQSLYFANPLNAKSALTNLLSTHPPIEERIKRLQAMY